MKPHIKKVNGQWTVANRVDCCVFQLASAALWCERMNTVSDFVRFSYVNSDGLEEGRLYRLNNKYTIGTLREVVEAEKANPEEPPVWMMEYAPISEKELIN